MRRRKFLVQQSEAPIEVLETTIKDVQTKQEDIDTITLEFVFQNGRRFSKKFYKYDFDYRKIWKNKRSGDAIRLKVKAGNIIDIC